MVLLTCTVNFSRFTSNTKKPAHYRSKILQDECLTYIFEILVVVIAFSYAVWLI